MVVESAPGGSPTIYALRRLALSMGGWTGSGAGIRAVEVLSGSTPLLRYAGNVFGNTVGSWHLNVTATGGFGNDSVVWTSGEARISYRMYLRVTASGTVDRLVFHLLTGPWGSGAQPNITPLFEVPVPGVSVAAGRMLAVDLSISLGSQSASYSGPVGASEVVVSPGFLVAALVQAFGPNTTYSADSRPNHMVYYPPWTWWEYKRFSTSNFGDLTSTSCYVSLVYTFELPLAASLGRFDFGNVFGGTGWSPAPSGAYEFYAVLGDGTTVLRRSLDGLSGVAVYLPGNVAFLRYAYVVLETAVGHAPGVTHFFSLAIVYGATPLSTLGMFVASLYLTTYMGATYLTWG
ncbi:MAG: hypothetical protein QXD60_02475 [Nanopusillaceae archaeon]